MEVKKPSRVLQKPVFVLITALLLFAADQIIKRYVLLYLRPTGTITVINGLLDLAYIENTGAAFGTLQNSGLTLIVLSCIAYLMIILLLFKYKNHTVFSYASAALLLGGGLGNMLDRIQLGFVVDFIYVLFFPFVFNFADCCITVGAVLFIIHVMLTTREERNDG